MKADNPVSNNYAHGDLLRAIRDSIAKLDKSIGDITIDDLAAVDEFHSAGRAPTESLFSQVSLSDRHHVLDVGCGLGGSARFVASKYGSKVSGIDLTGEYIEVGKELCSWVNLDSSVALHHGSALTMPFDDASFDGAYMLHVGMNIEDKASLCREIFRVLRPGSFFCVYDVMRINAGDLAYPVPWATERSICMLATPDQYRQALHGAGFEIVAENNRREFALAFFTNLREKLQSSGGPPPLGIHTLMKEDAAMKIKNMIDNIASGYIAPVEIIAYKKQ